MSRRRGFTLVELLVVIGIIAILIAILLPSLNKARKASQIIACMSNMRQMGSAQLMFIQDHQGFMPKAWFNTRPYMRLINGQVPTVLTAEDIWHNPYPLWGWDYCLNQYIKNKNTFRCPSDDNDTLRYNDPANPAAIFPASYRINLSDFNDPILAIRPSDVHKTSEAIFLVEGGYDWSPTLWHHVATWEPSGNQGHVSQADTKNVAFNRHSPKPNIKDPRYARSNYVFADGHAETVAWADTWKSAGPTTSKGKTTMWRHCFEVESWNDQP